MFDSLTDRLSHTLRKISNYGRLTENNIKDTLRQVRVSLLEADVALPVVKDFINQVKKKSIGNEINKFLTPGQEFVKIVRNELTVTMGKENRALNLAVKPPAVIMVVGLQGAGKTTSVGKLGKLLHEKHKKKVLAVSLDIYRPAAIKQLEIISNQADIDFFLPNNTQNPIDIASIALKEAKLKFYDVLLVDTAGYNQLNSSMMNEIKQIHTETDPVETLFVVDAMIGQDAASTAKAFNEELSLSGVILTKADGDMRGGAALSICHITGKPIKFLGIGEKIEALETFYPDRIASRILGMGNILSLIEDIENKVNLVQAEKIANKIKKGDRFDLIDLLEQIRQIKSIGYNYTTDLMNSLPVMGRIANSVKMQIKDDILVRMEAIVNSMTYKERTNPDIIKGSRKRRIAVGCGLKVQDINLFLKQFNEMRNIMKKVNKYGIGKIMRKISM